MGLLASQVINGLTNTSILFLVAVGLVVIFGLLDVVNMAHAARQGSDLIVFPEMSLTGYDDEGQVPAALKMQTRLAETIPGPASEAVAQAAKAHEPVPQLSRVLLRRREYYG